jgi:hypothetical protein
MSNFEHVKYCTTFVLKDYVVQIERDSWFEIKFSSTSSIEICSTLNSIFYKFYITLYICNIINM